MSYEINALVIIPAKTDSTRLSKKNLQKIHDKTLVEHAILYAKKSKLVSAIIITTESDEVRAVAEKFNDVIIYPRSVDFMGEREVADVYVNVLQHDVQKYGNNDLLDHVTHVVGVQPDHPDRTTVLDDLLNYAVRNKYDDLVTTNIDGTRNGAVRIVKKEYVISGAMSRRVGSYLDACTNIHSEEDLITASKNISNARKNGL